MATERSFTQANLSLPFRESAGDEFHNRAFSNSSRRFRSADYFSLEDKYIAGVTDNPTYITSIAFDTFHKSVVDYVGEYEGMPDAVRELEETIDQIVGSEKWIRRQ